MTSSEGRCRCCARGNLQATAVSSWLPSSSPTSCEVDLSELSQERTHELELALRQSQEDSEPRGHIRLLLCISGTAVEEGEEREEVESAVMKSTTGKYVSQGGWEGGKCDVALIHYLCRVCCERWTLQLDR